MAISKTTKVILVISGVAVILALGKITYNYFSNPNEGNKKVPTPDPIKTNGNGTTYTPQVSTLPDGVYPLKPKDKNKLVKQMQIFIKKIDASLLPQFGPDGQWGNETTAALIKLGYNSTSINAGDVSAMATGRSWNDIKADYANIKTLMQEFPENPRPLIAPMQALYGTGVTRTSQGKFIANPSRDKRFAANEQMGLLWAISPGDNRSNPNAEYLFVKEPGGNETGWKIDNPRKYLYVV